MAQRCSLGYHSTCRLCHNAVNPRNAHAHYFGRDNVRDDICNDCFALINRAALTVVATLRECGFGQLSVQLFDELERRGHLIIAVQIPFGLAPEREN